MNKVVIGAGYGDEGKGLMVDYLCEKAINPLVVRFNGGPQAAHTVVRDGERHVFGVLGSGTLLGVPTHYTKDTLIDPYLLMRSIIKYGCPGIFIHEDCRIITPADIIYNQFTSKAKTTCGMGIFATINRHKVVPFTFKSGSITEVIKYYSFVEDASFQSYINDSDMWGAFARELTTLRKYSGLTNYYFNEYIFEGAQGLLLDEQYGTMPYCTPSNTGLKNIQHILDQNDEVIYVTRCYQTRHGEGPLEGECKAEELGPQVVDLTNQYNKFQGGLRFAPLDLDTLLKVIREDSATFTGKVSIAITCLDQVDEVPTLRGNITKETFIKALANSFDNVYTSYGPSAVTLTKNLY